MAQLKCHGMCMRGSPLELRFSSSNLKRMLAEVIRSLRLITAIKTPYLPNGRLDLEAYDSLINMQIAQCVEGVIVGGTAGEGHLMSWDEHIMLIGHTVDHFGTSLKVIGNTGSNSTAEAMQATEQGFAVGMHASLHINPYYGRTSLHGLLAHFNGLMPMGPMIVYNVPARTGQDILLVSSIPWLQARTLSALRNVLDTIVLGSMQRRGITVWCGMDDQCHDSRWDFGATGVMSVASNLIPGLVRELVVGKKSLLLNEKVMPLIKWLFHEPNPIGLNTALAQLGVVQPIFRLPYVPLPLLKRLEFVALVKDIGREHFVGDREVQVLEDDDFISVGRY